MKQLTVVLPVFNEEDNLVRLLQRIERAFIGASFDPTVVVVDDGSTDRSAEVALSATSQLPITLIRHEKNMGLGAAMRTGLRAVATPDNIVVTMDADDSHDPALIPAMVEKLNQGHDVVIASRFQEDSQVIGVSAYRRFLTLVASTLLRIVFPIENVRDYSCGYRAYRGSVLLKLQQGYGLDIIRENGFACMLELLLKLRRIGARAAEVPMTLHYERKMGASKMRVARTVLRYGIVMSQCFSVMPSWIVKAAPVQDLPS